MKEPLSLETHTRVLLMNHLWSRRDEWYRVHTACKRISRNTDIAGSARGLTLQEPRAEDVLVESHLAQKILVI